jgi:hypothetical protein
MSEKPPAPASISVDTAFHPEQQQQAQADFDAYLQTRPYEDGAGAANSPEGNYINSDHYFDQQREAAEAGSQVAYEDMQPSQLVKKLAEAEFHGDRTSMGSIGEALDDKLAVMGMNSFSERDDSSTSSTREHPDYDVNHNDLRSQKLEDRISIIHDREMERLEAGERQPGEPENYQANPNDAGDQGGTPDDPGKTPEEGKAAAGEETPGPVTPATEQMPVEPATPATEQMPVQPGSQHQHEQAPEDTSRWARLKRGFWKHMYETPVDMSPMGPTIQPAIPFDEWYARKQQEPGRFGRAFDKATDKIVDVAGKTAEKAGDAAAFVDYIGNVALIETAYYAGEAVIFAKEKAEDTAAAAGNLTRKVDDFGNIMLVSTADAATDKAKRAASIAGKVTRKVDDAGNAGLERMAPGVDRSAELPGKAARKARYMGQLLMERMTDYGSYVANNVKRRMGHPSTWTPTEEEKKQFKDWQENWDWEQ